MRPKDLMIYYGWLSGFNAYWDNEKVCQDFARYDLLVFGDGLQDPSHGDYSNTMVILSRIKELNPNVLIFGYVTVNQDLSTFKTKTDQWNDLKVAGIFMDEAGYDYGKKRDELNERIAYVHSQPDTDLCFVNAWNMDHVIGTNDDPNFPNSTYNPNLLDTLLTTDDWYLLESFAVNTDSYSSNNGYASKEDWIARGNKVLDLWKNEEDLNIASVGIINDDNPNGQNMFNFSHHSALMFNLDANGVSDSSYGASSGKGKFWTRPSNLEISKKDDISIVLDQNNPDAYLRYAQNGKIMMDHTAGSQSSSVEKW